jgi:hypothetical protein
VRHRFNPYGHRRVNAVLHGMAVTQLRYEPHARQLYEQARQRGHTKTEAMRILERRLSDIVYRRMIRDIEATPNGSMNPRPPQTGLDLRSFDWVHG